MEMLQIEARKRETVGTLPSMKLRSEGYLPSVLYGHGKESLSLSLPEKEMVAYITQYGRIIDLDIEGRKERAIVKDIQYDAMGDSIIHVDLVRIRLDEVVSILVPIKIMGRAKGVDEGGIMEILRNEIQVKCLPTKIPEAIEVDVTELGAQDTVHLSDLSLPEEVELDEEGDYTVISMVIKKAVVEPEPEVEEGEEAAEGEEGEAPEGEADDAGSSGKEETGDEGGGASSRGKKEG